MNTWEGSISSNTTGRRDLSHTQHLSKGRRRSARDQLAVFDFTKGQLNEDGSKGKAEQFRAGTYTDVRVQGDGRNDKENGTVKTGYIRLHYLRVS